MHTAIASTPIKAADKRTGAPEENVTGAADGGVAVALGLGWWIADAYNYATKRKRLEHPSHQLKYAPAGLTSLKQMDARQRMQMYLDGIDTALRNIRSIYPSAEKPPSTHHTRERLTSLNNGDADAASSFLLSFNQLHVSITGWIMATAYRVGVAYCLGRALSDTVRDFSDNTEQLTRMFGTRNIQLSRWLDELSTALPPYSANVVKGSMDRWADEIRSASRDVEGRDKRLRSLAGQIYEQGMLWHDLLTEVLDPRDLLKEEDYAEVARVMVARDKSLLLKTARGIFWPVLFPALVAVIVIVAIGIVAAQGSPATRGAIALVGLGGWLAGAWRTISAPTVAALRNVNRPMLSAILVERLVKRVTSA